MNERKAAQRARPPGFGSVGAYSACMLLLSALLGHASAQSPPAGHDLLERVYREQGGRNVEADGRLTLHDAQGGTQEKAFHYRQRSGPGETRELLRFSAPAEIAGVTLLSIRTDGAPPRQYIYVPATRRVREIAHIQQAARVAGSDFTFEDIGRSDLAAFTWRTVGLGERLEGHATVEVEATPVDPASSQYARRLIWVAEDVPVILREQMFDRDGTLVRERRNHDLHREGGLWGARRSEMSTPKEGTHTVLSIVRVSFPAAQAVGDFTPEALERADGGASED